MADTAGATVIDATSQSPRSIHFQKKNGALLGEGAHHVNRPR